MNIRCGNCGAIHSLDALIADTDAVEVMRCLLELDAELGKAAIRYIGLFRPAKSQLSWSRSAKLLNELLPMIRAGAVERDGVSSPAPPEAWVYGFGETLSARDTGRLKTPLKSHGYLCEIVSKWRPSETAAAAHAVQGAGGDGAPMTKLRQGVYALTEWAGIDLIRREIAGGLATLSTMNLKGRPAAADLPVLAGLWEKRLQEKIVLGEGTQISEKLDAPRIKAAFAALRDVVEWPNVIDLLRNMPPRMMPREMLDGPAPDRGKGREEVRKLKKVLNFKQKGNLK